MFIRFLVLLLLVPTLAWGQPAGSVVVTSPKGGTPAGLPTSTSTDSNHTGLDVNVVGGGGTGGTSSNFGSASPAIGTASGARDTGGNMQPLQLDGAGTGQNLNVNCKAGCAAAGDTTTPSQAVSSGSGNLSTYPNGPAPNGLPFAGENAAAVTLAAAGTLVATLTPQCSTDGGTTYPVNGYFRDPFTGTFSVTTTIASGQAQTDFQVYCPGGSSHTQLKATSFTSGTANFTGRSTVVHWPSLLLPVTGTPSYTSGQVNTPTLTTSGALRTDASATTQPVSGSVSITGTASVNTAQVNGVAVNVGTGTAGTATQRVAVASDSSLTANIGTTGGLALDSSVAGLSVNQGSTTLGQKGPLFQGAVTTAAPSYTTGQTDPVSLDLSGNIRVNCTTGCAAPSDQTVASTALGASNATVTVPLTGELGASVQLLTGGNLIGTLTPEYSPDGGTTWYPAYFQDPVSGSVTTTQVVSSPGNTVFQLIVPNGSSHARVRVSSYTSGTTNATMRATVIGWTGLSFGNVTTAAPSYANSTINMISLTPAGNLRVDGSTVTQPISGNVGQSGTWTMQPGNTANTTPWLSTINQGGNSATVNASGQLTVNCAAGCSASSAADTTATGSLNAGGATVQVATAGTHGGAVEFASGTLSGSTVVGEVSTDGGTTWSSAVFIDPVSGAISTSLSNPSASQFGVAWALGGVSHFRVRVSVFGSGAVTANLRATVNRPYVVDFGSDGTNIRPFSLTTGGLVKVDLSGTAANGTAVKVDGSAVTQPVNVSQIAGTTTLTGNGTTGAGSQRVTIASDNSNAAGLGGSATGSAVPSAARYIGANSSGNLTGIIACDNWTAISQTAGAQLVTGVSAKKTYICSINLVTATAQNIVLVGGTGTVCATGTHAIAGGTTAATGWNLAANGGLAQGTGLGVIMQAGTAADNVCLLQSGAGQVSGAISWTQF